MHKKLSYAKGVAVEYISFFIGTYMHSVNEHFAVLNAAPGVLEINLTEAQRFNLRAHELKTRLEFLLNEIIVICFFITFQYIIKQMLCQMLL